MVVDEADLGKRFAGNLTDASNNRFDARLTTWGTSAYLSTLSPLFPCMRVIPTDTGAGFIKDEPMRRDSDNTIWLPDGIAKHLHDADSNPAGGLLTEVEQANQGNALRALYNVYNANEFYAQTTGTGAAVANELSSSIGRIRIEAGTSTNGYADASLFGIPLGFDRDSAIHMILEHEGVTTNYICRAGINAEMINLANNTAQASYGKENCSASGNNELIWSCKPPTRTTVSTGYAVDANIHSWFLQHSVADVKIYLTRDIDHANKVFKNTDIPVSSYTESRTLFGMGMKTTTSSASKILRFYGATVFGSYGDPIYRWYTADL